MFGPLELMLMLEVFVVSAGFIVAVVLVARYLFFRKNKKSVALDIVEQRFARGEINEAQLQEIKRNIFDGISTEQDKTAVTTRNTNPVVGGILSIICGAINFTFVLIGLVWQYHLHALSQFHLTLGIAGMVAVIGGIMAVRRCFWPLALTGAVASIISFTGLLGVVATVLVAVSKKQFK